MKQIERRDFLKRSAVLAVGASLIGTSRGWAGANERIRVAVIGMGGRGGYHMNHAAQIAGVEIATICDPDDQRTAKWAAELEKKTGKRPATEFDLRRIMDDPAIDAVMIATANHWHALATIYACQARKHVYVEKPVMHNVYEGRKMVEAARKYNCIVQGGTQRRSYGRVRKVVQLLRDGVIGDIYMARWVLVGFRGPIGFKKPSPPPPWLHWEVWRGPAREQPYHGNLIHYNWHWFWDFGNGEMGNNGSHFFDFLRWAIGKGVPTKVKSVGGRFGHKDQGETPNTQTTTMEYDDGTLVSCDIHGLHANEPTGLYFYGSKGHMFTGIDGNYKIYMGSNKEPEPDMGSLEHMDHTKNFFDAVRAGDSKVLTGDIEKVYLSCVMCELANISYRLGRELRFDPKAETFVDDPEADRLLTRKPTSPFVVPERV